MVTRDSEQTISCWHFPAFYKWHHKNSRPFTYWVIFHIFVVCCFFIYFIFSNSTFSKNYFLYTIRVSTSLDPDQARLFVKKSGLVWIQTVCRLSADDTRRQSFKISSQLYHSMVRLPDLKLVLMKLRLKEIPSI